MKKLLRFLRSMQFAIILLVILMFACIAGSLITQGQTYDWYAGAHGQTLAGLIIGLGLNDVFHTPWFLVIVIFLCVNLLSCNLVRLPSLIRRGKNEFDPKKRALAVSKTACEAADEKTVDELFSALRFSKVQSFETEGTAYRYAAKNKMGIWGAWVTHLGILILIIGFGAGEMLSKEYTVYGVPGQSKAIDGTSYIVSIEDFTVDVREDDTVSQYEAAITIRNAQDGSSESRKVSVNHPAAAYGLKFYQNSMGWAADLHVTKDGEELQMVTLCQSEAAAIEAVEGLYIYLAGFYPNYVEGSGMPSTDGTKIVNPGYLYRAVYQGATQQMNVLFGEGDTNEIHVNEEYTIYFDNPRYYTLIQVKKDPFQGIALIGGLVVMLGLILSFYVQPRELWARKENDVITVYAFSRKGGALYAEEFKAAAAKCGAKPVVSEEKQVKPGEKPEREEMNHEQ